MSEFPCPSCGAPVPFKSSLSVFAICPFCRSMLVRNNLNLEILGKQAELPKDLSPIQIGTSGRYDHKTFEVVGRLKIAWEDGFWTEWFVLFEDGVQGWLAEAQGFYMMSFEKTLQHQKTSKASFKKGQALELLPDQYFEIVDLKEASCVGAEGELPFKGIQGRKSLSIDLTGPNEQFACIDLPEDTLKDQVRVYVGNYVDFDDFDFKNLRELEGWS